MLASYSRPFTMIGLLYEAMLHACICIFVVYYYMYVKLKWNGE